MGKSEKKGSRILYMSRLKALACLAVVVLHGSYMGSAFAGGNLGRMTLLMEVRNLMMWAVPCFVMVSGALLLDKRREIGFKKLFSKYLLRIVIALFAFGEIFAIYDHAVYNKDFEVGHLLEGVRHAVFNTFTENGMSWSHTWYLYMMIALYLMLPVYRMVTRSAEKKELRYILGLYFVFSSVIVSVQTLTGASIGFYIFVSTVYPLYIFLGYCIHNDVIKLNKVVSCLFILIGAALMVWLTYFRLHTGNAELAAKVKDFAEPYTAPFTILSAAGMYALFKAFDNGKEIPVLDKVCAEIDRCSFGIYLIHMMVYKHIFATMRFDPFEHGGFGMLVLVMIAAFAISYAITRGLKFVPGVKDII